MQINLKSATGLIILQSCRALKGDKESKIEHIDKEQSESIEK
jgi:hypothetical protein